MVKPVKREIELLYHESFEKEFASHINKVIKERDDRNYTFIAAVRPSRINVLNIF